MDYKLFREYHYKFYLNASHSIIIGGKKGETHPHTWEYSLDIAIPRSDFMEFQEVESVVEAYFAKYQNHIINEIAPFDTIIPTLENMVDFFGPEIRRVVQQLGGDLLSMEGSETPTRSYIVDYRGEQGSTSSLSPKVVSQAVNTVLDSILK